MPKKVLGRLFTYTDLTCYSQKMGLLQTGADFTTARSVFLTDEQNCSISVQLIIIQEAASLHQSISASLSVIERTFDDELEITLRGVLCHGQLTAFPGDGRGAELLGFKHWQVIWVVVGHWPNVPEANEAWKPNASKMHRALARKLLVSVA